MKKLITIVILFFVFCLSGKAARIISSFDIARWYLDADLVLICNVKQTDTFTLSKHDTLLADGFQLSYNMVREKYQISIDSIIKGGQYISEKIDTIFTPDFLTNYSKMRDLGKEFTGFDSKGDSVFLYSVEMIYDNYYDDSYFRIKSQEKHLVILRKTEIGYVIDYETKCDSSIIELIQDVKLRGEGYFELTLSSETVKSNTISIYPNPFSDILNVKGVHAKRIEITDLYGKIVRIEMQDTQSIDLSSLKPGSYLISIFTNNNKWIKKIIKR